MLDQLDTPPLVVLWRVMDTCNLACPFCAYDKRLAFPRSAASPAEVSRVIGLLAGLQQAEGRKVMLSWLGGEPTLWQDFGRMTDQAAKAGLAQSLTTNGTTLGSSSLRARLADQFDEVTLSVDAIGQRHEDLRGWRGGFTKLERWVPKLAEDALAKNSALRVRANVVLMHDTLGEFENLCAVLADWGVSQITFNQLGGRDRPEFFPQNRLTADDVTKLKRVLPGLRSRLKSRGVELLGGDPYIGRIADSAKNVALKIDDCQVARNFLFIDEKGNIAPCAFVEDYFGVTTADVQSVAQFSAIPGQLCAIQKRCPADACKNCMSTQQFSKFATEIELRV
ncbi:radical SAM protein [Ruegeria arenilitoris]|uniref:radical SAM protein n=1 Tax=Ruegeria arenilitoris TaxID=1173585 RepID=UPI0014803E98|nr:radical SAM protein [Ruegeria arenilitoris]